MPFTVSTFQVKEIFFSSAKFLPLEMVGIHRGRMTGMVGKKGGDFGNLGKHKRVIWGSNPGKLW